MSEGGQLLLLFPSIHHVLAAEQALREAGVGFELVPVPREISPDCGMAVTVDTGERSRALAALEGTPPERVLEGWER
ncbi:MAG: DUF3343 domain-containing protein [Candidatus Brocadiia bacterium]